MSFIRLKNYFKGYVLEVDGILYFRIVNPSGKFNWFVSNGSETHLDIVYAGSQTEYLERELQKLIDAGAEDLCRNGGG